MNSSEWEIIVEVNDFDTTFEKYILGRAFQIVSKITYFCSCNLNFLAFKLSKCQKAERSIIQIRIKDLNPIATSWDQIYEEFETNWRLGQAVHQIKITARLYQTDGSGSSML